MSPVVFKKVLLSPVAIFENFLSNVTCRTLHHVGNVMSHVDIGFMSHVDFKKIPSYPVVFKGQEPHSSDLGYGNQT